MDSNVHIDDNGSSLLTHPRRHTRLQPRSAGFSYMFLDDFLEARKFNKQICEELVKGPPNATRGGKPPPEHRKHCIKTAFSSRSERKSTKENKKMSVATHRTSGGRKYGQILSEQVYDNSGNASTYQVNESRRPLAPPNSETQRKHASASLVLVGDITSMIHQVNGTKQLTVGNPNAGLGSPGNRLLADRLGDGNVAGQNEETLGPLPRKSTTDDPLGLLRDFSQILSQGETATLATSAPQIPEAEHQPRVRDFAANGSAPLSLARAAIRRGPRSPAKRTDEQKVASVTPDRSMDAVTHGGQSADRLGRSPNSIILPPISFKEPARPPLEPSLPMTQERVPRTKSSPVINYHSKAPSIVSADSTAEDIQSDASSGVVSNAQSAVFVKVPPQPGPAPLAPLPSLPEGLDNFASATPRASQSTRRLASPKSSPSKAPPQKSPVRSQYRLYPSVDSSPPKRPDSPIRMSATTEPKQIMTPPSPPLRSKRRGLSFSRSMNVGTLEELEQWKKARAENTRQRKLRDLAHTRSHKVTIAEIEPITRDTVNGEMHDDGVGALPSPMNSSSSVFFPVKHRPQVSQVSNLSASTTLQNRDSSLLPQKLSPIIVVVEQEPTSHVQQAPSPNPHIRKDNADKQTRGSSINGFYPVPPRLVSPTLQGSEDESKVRPLSSHSLPVPRPVASRVPTPYLSPLLRGSSYRSLHLSSMHEMSGLKARLSAMERKNAMLERAFLAVLNTSAAFGGSLGRSGMEGACGDTASSLAGRNGDRFSGTSDTESLNVGLENLMALHGGDTSARWSTSSDP